MTRMYGPDEEIPFHFLAAEVNALIAAVETTLGLPLRVTAPLREKILTQLNLDSQPPADGIEVQGELADPVRTASNGPLRTIP